MGNARRKQDVISWISKEKRLMEKEYLIVPIVLWSHWRLMIICGIGKEHGFSGIFLKPLVEMKVNIQFFPFFC